MLERANTHPILKLAFQFPRVKQLHDSIFVQVTSNLSLGELAASLADKTLSGPIVYIARLDVQFPERHH
jgi:hypothetical protein